MTVYISKKLSMRKNLLMMSANVHFITEEMVISSILLGIPKDKYAELIRFVTYVYQIPRYKKL